MDIQVAPSVYSPFVRHVVVNFETPRNIAVPWNGDASCRSVIYEWNDIPKVNTRQARWVYLHPKRCLLTWLSLI